MASNKQLSVELTAKVDDIITGINTVDKRINLPNKPNELQKQKIMKYC